jgi:hypothetical protein
MLAVVRTDRRMTAAAGVSWDMPRDNSKIRLAVAPAANNVDR